MEQFHGTTIVSVRRGDKVALGGDGQVTLGNIVMKGGARKVRRIYNNQVLVGFAGGTADAFSLLDRFEAKLEKHQGNLTRAAVELAKDWRTDRMLRRLEAMLITADATTTLVITGNGDVLDPEEGICAIGSGVRMRRRQPARSRRTPSCRRARSSRSRSRSPATCASTRTTTASSKRSSKDRTMSTMTPAEIVSELDKHIIGQAKAKKAVAVALRNRWRRQQVADPLRQEITPKNILMIGPTGVGKTEIARRLAKLADAPFIKIEATKFTEVGYVGRDVDSIVRDLIEISVKQTRESEMRKVRSKATDQAEDRILDILLPQPRAVGFGGNAEHANDDNNATRQTFRKRLREGQLDDKEVELDLEQPSAGMDIMAPPGMEEMTEQIRSMFSNLGSGKKQRRKVKIKEALKLLTDEEAAKMLNDEEVKTKAVQNVEQNGIVFLDEIDKITSRNNEGSGGEVSRQGVQRDLLPLVEGTTVNTKYGMVKTDHILFIASGAFHLAKPSDLIPELQGRFPIRVELDSLSVNDFEAILVATDASLVKQYQALLATEDVQLEFADDGIRRLAEIAYSVNEKTENIGARRLYTVIEKLLEEVSFSAGNHAGERVTIDAKYVDRALGEVSQDEDLSRYVL